MWVLPQFTTALLFLVLTSQCVKLAAGGPRAAGLADYGISTQIGEIR